MAKLHIKSPQYYALRLLCTKLFVYDEYFSDFCIPVIQRYAFICCQCLYYVVFALFRFGNFNFSSRARQLSVKRNLGLDLT